MLLWPLKLLLFTFFAAFKLLTLLITNGARSFACALAGSLAFATTTMLDSTYQFPVIKTFDMLHKPTPFKQTCLM